MKQRKYTDPIPPYGKVMSIEEWDEMVDSGMIMDEDGLGYWCKDGLMSREDQVFECTENDATHVCWFNK